MSPLSVREFPLTLREMERVTKFCLFLSVPRGTEQDSERDREKERERERKRERERERETKIKAFVCEEIESERVR